VSSFWDLVAMSKSDVLPFDITLLSFSRVLLAFEQAGN